MSNQSTAIASMSSTVLRKPGKGFWRSFFAAWVASYGNRIDPEGGILIEG